MFLTSTAKMFGTVLLPLLSILGWLQIHQTETQETTTFQGYIEGEFLYIAAPLAGNLTTLAVQRGTTVKQGTALFTLDPEPETTAVREAQAKLHSAQARLNDLQKGQRPLEIQAILARNKQAEADLELAKLEQTRYETLFRQKVIQKEILDNARATTQRNQARLEEVTAQLQIAQLAAREDLISAAEAEVATAKANLDKQQWWLTQKQVTAPQTGQIVDTFYYEGEWVPAGSPVLSLLPPKRVKVRFFVPELLRATIQMGQPVRLNCDGCAPNLIATINYLAAQAEYTPPVIYSRESRAKLVYLVEATLASEIAVKLHPGQPVDIQFF
jgi:HlyD family secretion protein